MNIVQSILFWSHFWPRCSDAMLSNCLWGRFLFVVFEVNLCSSLVQTACIHDSYCIWSVITNCINITLCKYARLTRCRRLCLEPFMLSINGQWGWREANQQHVWEPLMPSCNVHTNHKLMDAHPKQWKNNFRKN